MRADARTTVLVTIALLLYAPLFVAKLATTWVSGSTESQIGILLQSSAVSYIHNAGFVWVVTIAVPLAAWLEVRKAGLFRVVLAWVIIVSYMALVWFTRVLWFA